MTLFYAQESTTKAQILAASLTPGAFTEPEVFENRRQWSGSTIHKRVRYAPDAPFTQDTRVFALLAAPTPESFPDAALEVVACPSPEDACFALTLDGEVTTLHLTQRRGYTLSSAATCGDGLCMATRPVMTRTSKTATGAQAAAPSSRRVRGEPSLCQ